MAVSPPWDFHCDYSLIFKWLWTPLLSLLLKGYLLKNYGAFKDILWRVLTTTYSIKSVDSVTCTISGYKDVNEYYDDSSACRFMHKISKPTIAISSVDDPICNVRGCPTDTARFGPGLIAVIVEHGGHLGFAEHIFPLNSSWIDRISVEWFDALRNNVTLE
jgi:predicted alpha/beta-fold hydrolase